MSVEMFFQKFDMLAETPEAMAQLRELVLRLAVTGCLSSPELVDEPVAPLIERLHRAKVESGRRVKVVDHGPIDGDFDPPIRIPDHWAWVRLCDIGTISGGHTPSKTVRRFWDGSVNWFTSQDIKSDDLHESALKITEAAASGPGLQLYPPGCLFMVARSGILKRTFPVAINRVPATANQDLKVLWPFVADLDRYLQVMFRGLTGYILSHLVKTGMTVQSLKYDEFAAHPFPIPPLAEQRRIVAKVNQLMALVDQLEAQLAAAHDTGEKLMAAVVHELTDVTSCREVAVSGPRIRARDSKLK